jgi:3-phenylpropionate/trans-cinnamate dioxygenase ferredoxin subunit
VTGRVSIDCNENPIFPCFLGPKTLMPTFIKVAARADLPPGGKMVIDVDGRPIALFHVDGGVYAIDDVCTHDGGPLADGKLTGCLIECPRHGARFDVRTGHPMSMPAFEPVTRHTVEVRGEDIFVALDAPD